MDNNNSCSNFTDKQLETLGLVQVGSGVISCLSCIFIFFIMLIHKKWIYHSQRLILYLTIAVLLNSGTHIARGLGYNMVHEGTYCLTVAFLDQLGDTFVLSAIGCLLAEITINGNFKKNTTKLEPVYVLTIFVVPILFGCIPFAFDAYGPTSVWCWIRAHNTSTCEFFSTGIILQYTLWYGPVFVVSLIGFIACAITLIVMHKQSREYSGVFNPDEVTKHKMRMKELKQYRWYPLVLLVINIPPLAARIVSDINSDFAIFPLWIVATLMQGLEGSCIAFIFAIDSETRKRLTWKHLKAGCLYNICRKSDASEYPAMTGNVSDSLHTHSHFNSTHNNKETKRARTASE